MATRSQRAAIAAETVAIVRAGEYSPAFGKTVSIQDSLAHSIAGTVLFTPGEFRSLRGRAESAIQGRSHSTTFEVRNENEGQRLILAVLFG